MKLRLLFATCILAIPGAALAQSEGTRDRSGSTQGGVYTAAQAAEGGELYALRCASCHPAATHTGPAFATKWDGHALSELFQYISEEMPKQDPGSLSPEEYALALAYMLKLNGMPAGPVALSSDPKALQKIRIDLKPTRGSSEPR